MERAEADRIGHTRDVGGQAADEFVKNVTSRFRADEQIHACRRLRPGRIEDQSANGQRMDAGQQLRISSKRWEAIAAIQGSEQEQSEIVC